MSDKPIIFSAPMVRALLEGRKTQTRRISEMIRQDDPASKRGLYVPCDPPHDYMGVMFKARYRLGDRLYVREAWRPLTDALNHMNRSVSARINYRADESKTWLPIPETVRVRDTEMLRKSVDGRSEKWVTPIHMPRWASRLTLTVTDVRVQRLQDISEADAMAEGVDAVTMDDVPRQAAMSRRSDFAALWNSLHGPEAWDANPWVAAYTFSVQHGNIDMLAEQAQIEAAQ